jgi:hypothetical protein
VVNVTPRYAKLRDTAGKVFGWENIELISDRPFETMLAELKRLKQEYPDRVLIASIMEEVNKWVPGAGGAAGRRGLASRPAGIGRLSWRGAAAGPRAPLRATAARPPAAWPPPPHPPAPQGRLGGDRGAVRGGGRGRVRGQPQLPPRHA